MRVNAIAPSLTDTPLAKNLLASEEKRKSSADRHPPKRVGTPQEIARGQHQGIGALRRGRMPHDGLKTRTIAGSHWRS